MLKIGFIGAGNMGYALAKAVKNSAVDTRIYISNRTKEKAERYYNFLSAPVEEPERTYQSL